MHAAGDTRALLSLDEARSPDPRVCPFFRFIDEDGALVQPHDGPHPRNQCLAFGEPHPISARQQELVCQRTAHTSCPRYLRGMLLDPRPAAATGQSARFSRATILALIVLVASAGVSFGFVLQRGGIALDLGAASAPTATSATSPTATSPADEPSASLEAATQAPLVAASQGPTQSVAPTPAPSASPVETPTPAPATPAPTPTAEPSPVATRSPTAPPTPGPTPAATAAGSSERYALLEPCPNAPDCWIYTVRAGDNFVSIVSWFGVPYDTVVAMNPGLGDPTTIRQGDRIRMPPPTR